MENIKIEYDGGYPCLCMGKLIVWINSVKYDFPPYCLSSGGSCSFDNDWNSEIESGPWDILQWPENFPEEYKEDTIKAVNLEIPWGCCGGCL